MDILTIALCGAIAGADSWVDVETFGLRKEEWLREMLELPVRTSPAPCCRIVQAYPLLNLLPRDRPFHPLQKQFAARLAFLARVVQVGERLLLSHGLTP